MHRKLLWGITLMGLLSLGSFTHAQQRTKSFRIGYLSLLSPSSDTARHDSFRRGLRELGYVDDKNVVVESRYAEGDTKRLPKLAAELVSLKPDVVLAGGSTAIGAMKKATSTIPIVMAHGSDPVELGYVASLAKPGGNITGLTHLAPELGGKRLEFLKHIVPKLSRVAILTDPETGGHGPQMKEVETAGPALGLQLRPFEARDAGSLENAFSAMSAWGAGALVVLQLPTLDRMRASIVDFAAKNRVPAIYPNDEYVQAGGMVSYAADILAMFRRSATYVDRILKGANPGDLPVEQPTKFELVINLKTAKQIGLTIPPNVLARADRVIK
jgi:putative ABC transport system substrate-binding protein